MPAIIYPTLPMTPPEKTEFLEDERTIMANPDIIGACIGKEDGRSVRDLRGRDRQGEAQDANGQECQHGTCEVSESRISNTELNRIRKEVQEELARTTRIDVVTGGFP